MKKYQRPPYEELVVYQLGLVIQELIKRLYRRRTQYRAQNPLKPLVFALLMSAGLLLSAASPAHAGELANQFSVSLWVKADSSPTTKALAVKNNEIRLVTDASGNPLCQIHNGTSWQTAATSSTAITANTWAFVACSYDKTTLKVYVNGIETGSTSLSVTVNDTANSFKVGTDDGGTYGDFAGTVDDFRVYNYARTQKQVMQDMNAGHPSVGSPVGSPVLYLKFDEGYGDTANDSSPQNNDGDLGGSGQTCPATGTVPCPTWTDSGKLGKALSFDGSDDYVDLPSGVTNIINGSSNISWSLWAYANGTKNYSTTIGAGSSYQIQQYTTGDGNMMLQVKTESGTYNANIASGFTYGTWHHLVFTYDGNTLRHFLDGNLIASNSSITGSISTPSDTYIGSTPALDSREYWNGLIDEVKIYNYALTEDEVRAEYNQGKALVMGATSTASDGSTPSFASSREYCPPGDTSTCNPPVGEWLFDENTGTGSNAVKDTSGNGNNGTMESSMTESDWVPGKHGSAMEFDGVDDYVQMSGMTYGSSTQLTMSAWVYSNTNSQHSYAGIISARNNSNGMQIRSTGGNEVTLWASNTSEYYKDTGYSLPLNQWVYLTYTFNNGIMKLFANGVKQYQVDNSASITQVQWNNYLAIGQDMAVSGRNFNGLIDQVRIYDYARTPAQIAWEYNRGAPIAHYKFDECTGTTAYNSAKDANGDAAGNNGTISIGGNGTNTSAGNCGSGTSTESWNNGTTGKRNASLDFDGTDDYVSTADDPFDMTGDMTVSTWIKAADVSEVKAMVSKYDVTTDAGWLLLYGTDGLAQFDGRTGQATYYSSGNSTTNVADGSWHHIVGKRSGSVFYIYVDGVPENSTTNDSGSFANAKNLEIGRNSSTTTSYFNGQMDDVQIFNYALTQEQIKMLYNSGAVRFGE